MIDIKALEKSAKIFEKIKKLDSEIIEIDKYALLVANGDCEPSFELHFVTQKNKEEIEEETNKSESSGTFFYIHQLMSYKPITEASNNTNTEKLADTLTENATLQILGILLCEKYNKRTQLLKQLEKYGVQVH